MRIDLDPDAVARCIEEIGFGTNVAEARYLTTPARQRERSTVAIELTARLRCLRSTDRVGQR